MCMGSDAGSSGLAASVEDSGCDKYCVSQLMPSVSSSFHDPRQIGGHYVIDISEQ